MNKPQKWIARTFVIATIAYLLFPPWKTVFIGGWYSPKDWSEGYAFILTPPLPSTNAYQYRSELHVRIDASRLLLLVGINLAMFTGLYRIFRQKHGESVAPFYVFLQKRKLAISFLLALGIPIPPLGPVCYALPELLIEGSHVWFGAMLFIMVIDLCLFAAICLVLTIVAVFLRRRLEHALLASAQ